MAPQMTTCDVTNMENVPEPIDTWPNWKPHFHFDHFLHQNTVYVRLPQEYRIEDVTDGYPADLECTADYHKTISIVSDPAADHRDTPARVNIPVFPVAVQHKYISIYVVDNSAGGATVKGHSKSKVPTKGSNG